ncbi:unnamed protein product [Durusdinium trenchii]|uniref:Adenylate kinase n=1 Tax=Durusdinium trenchii TaxID=1381693 RepID=A0ABP0HV92_9DINO
MMSFLIGPVKMGFGVKLCQTGPHSETVTKTWNRGCISILDKVTRVNLSEDESEYGVCMIVSDLFEFHCPCVRFGLGLKSFPESLEALEKVIQDAASPGASEVFRELQAHVTLVLSALDEVKKHVEVPCSASRDELNKPRHELDIEMKGSPDLGVHHLAVKITTLPLNERERGCQNALAKEQQALSEAHLLELKAEKKRLEVLSKSQGKEIDRLSRQSRDPGGAEGGEAMDGHERNAMDGHLTDFGPVGGRSFVSLVGLGHLRQFMVSHDWGVGGKGTQAGYLADRYGLIHISMGDLLRARAKFLPQLAQEISEGRLVPDDTVVSVLKERLAEHDCFSRGVLLDGFPRTRTQAEALRLAGVEISAVIHLEVADDVVINRIAGRRIDPLSGKIYHVKDNPPPAEIMGRVIQREDDTPEKIRRRLVTYHQERDAILDFCRDRVRTIHVGGGAPDALPADVRSRVVFDEVRKAVEGDTYWGSMIRSELIAKVPILMVFGGCMGAIVAMEVVLKGDPKSGNLLTLTAVLMVLFQSIPGRLTRHGLKPLAAPWRSHGTFAALWVSMSVLANYAFAYKISVAIFTLIRSCNIIATVLLGFLVFGQRFSVEQLACVVAVTLGIFLASMGEMKTLQSPSCDGTGCGTTASAEIGSTSEVDIGTWLIGLGMLAFVQLLQGFLGNVQSNYYRIYKDLAPKNELCDEFLFTSHIVALAPLFFLKEDIMAAAESAWFSEPLPLVPVPSRLAWLFINNVSQTICLKGVFRTSACVSPLALTIILSVRKFLSVVVSIVIFSNPWTILHSIATVLIFGGAFAYSQAPEARTAPAKADGKAE